MYKTLLRRQGQLQKPDSICGLGMLDRISLEERRLARTDCTLAPSPVNYMRPCCHLVIMERWTLREGFSENHSACLTSRLRPEQWNSAEWTDCQAKGTNWHQGREESQDCNDQRLYYHLLGVEWKILLACGLDFTSTWRQWHKIQASI